MVLHDESYIPSHPIRAGAPLHTRFSALAISTADPSFLAAYNANTALARFAVLQWIWRKDVGNMASSVHSQRERLLWDLQGDEPWISESNITGMDFSTMCKDGTLPLLGAASHPRRR